MDKIYSGYELKINKKVEDIAYDGKMIRIEGNHEQKIIEGVEGKAVTGEYITATDITKENGRIIISGNSKQETRSGKNSLELQDGTYSHNGVTATVKNGVVTLNGTATALAFPIIPLKNDITLLTNTQYTLRAFNEKAIGSEAYQCALRLGDDGTRQAVLNTENAKYIHKTSEYSFNHLTIRTAEGITYNNFVIKPQLELGAGTDIWEQGGVMPSPDYPSEIKAVGDNVNIFEATETSFYSSVAKKYAEYLKETNEYHITSTQTWSRNQFDNFEVGKTYTLSFEFKSVTTNSLMNDFFRIDKVSTGEMLAVFDKNILTSSEYKKYSLTFIATEASLNINIRNAAGIDAYIKNIKLEEGSTATPYSSHGQGCITEVISNKNIFDLDTYYNIVSATNCSKQLLNNGIRLNFNAGADAWIGDVVSKNNTISESKRPACIKVKTNTTYTLNISSAPKCLISFLDENYQAVKDYIMINSSRFTFTTDNSTKYIYLRLGYQNVASGLTSYDFTDIELVEGTTVTPYEPHQEQSYIIPTQQPMRSVEDTRDTFIKKNNKWYERHYIKRLILNGTETYESYTNSKGLLVCYLTSSNLSDYKQGDLKSNYFIETKTIIGEENKNCIYANTINIQFINTNITSIEDFKTWLVEQYNAGTPVYVDYILQTPTDIECTEEQSKVLEELYNATIYIPVTNIFSEDSISPIVTLKYDYVIPSPSLEIPSEVEAVGSNVNFLDFTNYQSFTASNTYYAIKSNSFKLEQNIEYIFNYNASGDFSTKNEIILWFRDANNSSFKDIQANKVFSLTEEELNKLSYIQVVVRGLISGKSYSGYIYPKIEKGSTTTPYSPHGQGSVKVTKCNKNLYNGIITESDKRISTGTGGSYNTTGYSISEYIQINENTSYIINTNYSSYYAYYDSNKKYITGGAFNSNLKTRNDISNAKYIKFDFKTEEKDSIQLEQGQTVTPYEQHQEQSYIIPTQQEMLEEDYFDFDNEEEVHSWKKLVLNGTEEWQMGTINDLNFFIIKMILSDFKYINDNTCNYICNTFEAIKVNNRWLNNSIYISVNKLITITSNDFTSISGFKSYLTTQYTNGTPVIVYYKLSTPMRLPFTDEQKAVGKRFSNIELYDGINYIYSPDKIQPLLTMEYHYKIGDYDFYLSSDGYLNIPSLGIRYLVDLNDSSIPIMPEATESSVKVAGRDGDVPLKTTYEPIPFSITCYTEDNLTAMEKTEQERKINIFLNSIKNKTKKFAIERTTSFYEVKYSGALTTINYPQFLKFSIPFKSSDSYGRDITKKIMFGDEKANSDTIKEAGALITIKGPANSPIISLNDYSIEYSTTILEENRIEIDTNKSTVTHINSDGVKTNVMKYYNHQFPKIENGENELKILSGIDDKNKVSIEWNNLKL